MFTAKEARDLTNRADRIGMEDIQEEIKKAAKIGLDFIVVSREFRYPLDRAIFFMILKENGYETVELENNDIVICW